MIYISAIDREHEHDFKDRILLLPNYVSIKEVVRFQIADVSGFSTCKQLNLQPTII